MRSNEIPRELIPWYPTVNPDACLGDQECLNFCKNDVCRWDDERNVPVVANPYTCVLGCTACMKACTADAITFPTIDELRQAMRRLRAALSSDLAAAW